MDARIKKDIISVLQQTIQHIERRDFSALKELSNHVIHNASIYQDADSVQTAVAVYALSKILERAIERHEELSKEIIKVLTKAVAHLTADDEGAYRQEMDRLFKEVSEKDDRFLMFVQSVVEKANIVKGSNIYERGISLGRAAEITGMNKWDLMSFVGKTKIADLEMSLEGVEKRLSFAKKLFKVL